MALLLARARRASQAEDLALLQRELADSLLAIRTAARTAGTELLAEQVDELGIALNRRRDTIAQIARDHVRARETALRIVRDYERHDAELGATEAFDATKPRIIRAAVTETATAFNDSRAEALQGFDTVGILMREWVVDGNPCIDCESHDGEQTGINESFGGDEPGSMHPNCLLPSALVEGSIQGALKARYSGDVVHVRTRSGRTLSVTPNHPVLTSSGMRPAGELRKGDYLLGYSGDARLGSFVLQPDIDRGPSSAAEVFDTLHSSGLSGRSSCSALDLHGDAQFVDGNIDVVCADGTLLTDNGEAASERIGNFGFPLADIELPSFTGLSSRKLGGERISFSAPRRMRSGHLSLSFARRHPGPLHPLRIGLASQLHASASHLLTECCARDSYGETDIIQRFPGVVSGNDACEIKSGPINSPRSSEKNSGGTKHISNREPTDTGLFGDIARRFPGIVAPDQVACVDNEAFSGHVYDVQSSTGWIVAQGIVTSNCRCVWIPVSASMRAA